MFLTPDGPEVEIADSAAKFLSRAIPVDRLHGVPDAHALYERLADAGHLFLGHAESLGRSQPALRPVAPNVYRREGPA